MGEHDTSHGRRRGFFAGACLTAILLALQGCANWSQVTPSPPRAESARLAMAQASPGTLVLYVSRSIPDGETETWRYDVAAAQWTKLGLTLDPGPRRDFAMAHVQPGMVLLTGGVTSGPGQDRIWAYTEGASAWRDVTGCYEQVPPPRSQHAMAYLGHNQVLLHGGRSPGGATLGDTWLLSEGVTEGPCPGGQWREITDEAGGELPLRQHAMAYAGDDRALMFGGKGQMAVRSDATWVFENGQWSEVTPVDDVRPQARASHAMAFGGGSRVVLFGGQGATSNPLGDSWWFVTNDGSWLQDKVNGTAPEPDARYEAAMAESALDRCAPVTVILVDGTTGVSTLGDTWRYGVLEPPGNCP